MKTAQELPEMSEDMPSIGLLTAEWRRISDGAKTRIMADASGWLMCRSSSRAQPYVIYESRFFETHNIVSTKGDFVSSLQRRISGGLKSAIDAHGPITMDHVGSAVKRIMGLLVGKTTTGQNGETVDASDLKSDGQPAAPAGSNPVSATETVEA